MASFKEKLALLPDDIREVVESLSPEQAAAIIDKLIQRTELEYKALKEADVEAIKARTAEKNAYGFMSVDVNITWEELRRPRYISLGAFDQQEKGGPQVPVAFVIAELSTLDEIQDVYLGLDATPEASGDPGADAPTSDVAAASTSQPTPLAAAEDTTERAAADASSSTVSSSSGSSSSAGFLAASDLGDRDTRRFRQLLAASGWSPSDTIVSVFYLGVDYEYRRQGIGRQLLDLVQEVGKAASARMMWLPVAEWNPNALAFYERYGFKKTQDVWKGNRGNHLLLVYPFVSSPARAKSKRRKGPPTPKGRGFGAAKAQASLLTTRTCASVPGRLQQVAAPPSHSHRFGGASVQVLQLQTSGRRGATAGVVGVASRPAAAAPSAPRAAAASVGQLAGSGPVTGGCWRSEHRQAGLRGTLLPAWQQRQPLRQGRAATAQKRGSTASGGGGVGRSLRLA